MVLISETPKSKLSTRRRRDNHVSNRGKIETGEMEETEETEEMKGMEGMFLDLANT